MRDQCGDTSGGPRVTLRTLKDGYGLENLDLGSEDEADDESEASGDSQDEEDDSQDEEDNSRPKDASHQWGPNAYDYFN